MFKIQKTSVSDQGEGRVRVDMQISDQKDLEQSAQHVVFSVLVSTEVRPR